MALKQPAKSKRTSFSEIFLLINISGTKSSNQRGVRATAYNEHPYWYGRGRLLHKSNLRPNLDQYDQR